MKLNFEIKAAEGGDDAKLLTKDLANMYIAFANRNSIKIMNYNEVKASLGWLRISFTLEGNVQLLSNESGGHRFQRIPSTETKGRTHTSTVTVVVSEFNNIKPITFKDDDFKIETKRGSGNGGQHRNKTDSMVVITHIATGLKASRDGRCQHHNKKEARKIVEDRVKEYFYNINFSNETNNKKMLAGSGERGDKIRTYRYQDNIVTDHRTGRKCSLQNLIDGKFEKVL